MLLLVHKFRTIHNLDFWSDFALPPFNCILFLGIQPSHSIFTQCDQIHVCMTWHIVLNNHDLFDWFDKIFCLDSRPRGMLHVQEAGSTGLWSLQPSRGTQSWSASQDVPWTRSCSAWTLWTLLWLVRRTPRAPSSSSSQWDS